MIASQATVTAVTTVTTDETTVTTTDLGVVRNTDKAAAVTMAAVVAYSSGPCGSAWNEPSSPCTLCNVGPAL